MESFDDEGNPLGMVSFERNSNFADTQQNADLRKGVVVARANRLFIVVFQDLSGASLAILLCGGKPCCVH